MYTEAKSLIGEVYIVMAKVKVVVSVATIKGCHSDTTKHIIMKKLWKAHYYGQTGLCL